MRKFYDGDITKRGEFIAQYPEASAALPQWIVRDMRVVQEFLDDCYSLVTTIPLPSHIPADSAKPSESGAYTSSSTGNIKTYHPRALMHG